MQTAASVDTSDIEPNFAPLIPASPSARNRPGAHKIAGGALLELLSDEAVRFLGAEAVGCLFLLLQKMLTEGFTSIQYPSAVRLIHIHAKVRQEQAREILGLLLDAGVVSATGGETAEGFVHIPALSRAVEAIDGERSRRVQGWSARRKNQADKTGLDAQTPAEEAAESASTAGDVGQESEADVSFSAEPSAGDEVTTVATDDGAGFTDDDLMGAVSLMDDVAPPSGADASGAAAEQTQPTPDLFPEGGERLHYLTHGNDSRDGVADIVAVDGTTVRVTRGYIDWLQQAVPNVDVEQQTRLAAAWCQENKSRRKTVKRMGAFLLSWMSRNSSSLRIQQGAAEQSARRGQFGSGHIELTPQTGKSPVTQFDDGIGDLADLEMLPVVGDGASMSFPV